MATILRVLTDGATGAGADLPWALHDGDRLVRSGRAPPAGWPDADAREAVLAAQSVRLAHVVLPPMPADRVPQAVAFALEDQVAGPAGAQHLAASPRDGDGVDVAIVARSLVAALARSFDRVVAEPAIAPKPGSDAWRWYRSGLAGGFVRRADGSAFATSPVDAQGNLPPELALPLRHAARASSIARVEVAFDAEDAQLRAWSASGVAFVRADAWQWDASGVAVSRAFDLLQGEYSRVPRAALPSWRGPLRWAAAFAIAALAIHVGATLLTWGGLRYRQWQAERAIVEAARSAGVADAGGSTQAAAALAARHAQMRHRAGLTAPPDALPLLARAAPSIALLPPGTLKSATYAGNAWTLDLGKVDPAIAAEMDRRLAEAGLVTLSATSPSGTRVRIAATEIGAR
ncbi:MAG: type II secretion system protein GspL [Burkholderiales bacterium]